MRKMKCAYFKNFFCTAGRNDAKLYEFWGFVSYVQFIKSFILKSISPFKRCSSFQRVVIKILSLQYGARVVCIFVATTETFITALSFSQPNLNHFIRLQSLIIYEKVKINFLISCNVLWAMGMEHNWTKAYYHRKNEKWVEIRWKSHQST